MTTLLTRGNDFIIVILLNSASAVLDLILYISKLGLNILSVPCLLEYRTRIVFA